MKGLLATLEGVRLSPGGGPWKTRVSEKDRHETSSQEVRRAVGRQCLGSGTALPGSLHLLEALTEACAWAAQTWSGLCGKQAHMSESST